MNTQPLLPQAGHSEVQPDALWLLRPLVASSLGTQSIICSLSPFPVLPPPYFQEFSWDHPQRNPVYPTFILYFLEKPQRSQSAIKTMSLRGSREQEELLSRLERPPGWQHWAEHLISRTMRCSGHVEKGRGRWEALPKLLSTLAGRQGERPRIHMLIFLCMSQNSL